ncbi:pirin-like C-terminal cupin domain-containing protein, partial [Idiomarina sp. UBA1919]
DSFSLPSQGQKRRLAYVYQGELTVNGEGAKEGELILLDPAETLDFSATEHARFILLAAKPIEEP